MLLQAACLSTEPLETWFGSHINANFGSVSEEGTEVTRENSHNLIALQSEELLQDFGANG